MGFTLWNLPQPRCPDYLFVAEPQREFEQGDDYKENNRLYDRCSTPPPTDSRYGTLPPENSAMCYRPPFSSSPLPQYNQPDPSTSEPRRSISPGLTKVPPPSGQRPPAPPRPMTSRNLDSRPIPPIPTTQSTQEDTVLPPVGGGPRPKISPLQAPPMTQITLSEPAKASRSVDPQSPQTPASAFGGLTPNWLPLVHGNESKDVQELPSTFVLLTLTVPYVDCSYRDGSNHGPQRSHEHELRECGCTRYVSLNLALFHFVTHSCF